MDWLLRPHRVRKILQSWTLLLLQVLEADVISVMYEIFCITFKSSERGPVEPLRLLHAPTAGPRLLQHLAALRFLTVLQQLIALDSEQKSDGQALQPSFLGKGHLTVSFSTISTTSCIPWKSVVVL
jgi:hypothetical protein